MKEAVREGRCEGRKVQWMESVGEKGVREGRCEGEVTA